MAVNGDLITLTESGLFCSAGNFYIDPWGPVDRAVITHAHSDHAQAGSKAYLTAVDGVGVLRARLGDDVPVQGVRYGELLSMGDVQVSLLPAGHVLGSAQVRVSHRGEVWVVSSDYKTAPDSTCEPFALVRCNTFITESTFGLPIYRWRHDREIFDEINNWWSTNRDTGKCSIIFGYALGKAQRILAGLDPSIGPIYTHGAVERLTQQYRAAGVALPETSHAGSLPRGTKFGGCLVLAPPSAQGTPWMRQFGTVSTAFASGWMRIRGTRRRKSVDKGFVLSDHADWDELNKVICDTGAERIIVTHGYTAEIVRWLSEKGMQAESLATHFEGELAEMQPDSAQEPQESDESAAATVEAPDGSDEDVSS
jgi:putative mRNA 3-end processing factor